MSASSDVRATLDYPVIDTDGHMAEYFPALAPYLEQEGIDLGHPDLASLLPAYSGSTTPWHDQSPEERALTRTPRGPWWSAPSRMTLDLATALFPGLLYERMEEIGLDYSVIYPSLGLIFLHSRDDAFRTKACRALNRSNAETFSTLSDRLTPVAAIPMVTPEEAIAELEYAVETLGMKAVLMAGYVQRPFDALKDAGEEVNRYAFWLDQFGIDSLYDYDPVWERARQLGVSVAFHSGFIGMTPFRSPTSYVANHLSMLAVGQQSLAKSLFLGGVTHRFPELNFAFLEGGVGWAVNLFSDLIGHWEKRNIQALRANLDPALVDRTLMAELIGKYGPNVAAPARGPKRRTEPDALMDEFARCGITSEEDFRRLFVAPFYFGCEADDPITSWAFATHLNPLGAELQVLMGSDIAHWDLPDMSEVVEEAYEMVEHGWIDGDAFRRFTFENPVTFYTRTNPRFFSGTSVEHAVDHFLTGV